MAKKGDLLVTIKGDATSFDKTMTSSTNQIRKMQQQSAKAEASFNKFGGQIQGLASGALMKFAGAVGAAYTAQEVFNKTIAGSQTLTDDFNRSMEGAKAGVDYFFSSLATGDWSNFLEGLKTSIASARELYDILDKLADKQTAGRYFGATEKREWAKHRAIITDPNATKEQKQESYKAMQKIDMVQRRRESEQAYLLDKAADKELATKAGETGISLDRYMLALSGDDGKYNYFNNQVERLEKEIKDETKSIAQGTSSSGAVQYSTEISAKGKEAEKKLITLIANNAELNTIRNVLDKATDDDNISIAQKKEQSQALLSQSDDRKRQMNRYHPLAYSTTKGTGSSSNTPTIFVDGSFAKIDQEIKEWEKKYNEASDSVSRNHAQNMINALKDSKIEKVLEDMGSLDVNELNLDQIQEIKRTFNTLLGDVTDKNLRETIQKTIKLLDDSISKKELKIQAEMQAKWNISMPTSYDGVRQTFEEQKSLEQAIEKLSLQIKGTKDPSERANLVDQRSTKEARLSELRAQQNRPYITNTLDEEVLNKLGIKGGQTVDFTDQKDLNKYKNHIFDVLENFRSTFDDSTHNLYHQIVSKLTSELLLVGQRIWDLNDDEFNIDLANILDQSNPENRQSLLNSLADVKVGIENREAQLQYMKNDFETLKLNGVDSESLGAFLMEIQAQEASVKGLIDFYNQLLGIYEVGQDNLIEKFRQNVETTNQWRDALSEVGNMFYHIGSISDESTARTLSGLSSAFGAIQQMIPAIKTLTLMKQKDALAAAISSGAAMPFPSNLFAIASGAAAVIAAFSQMSSVPKFADGGIVYGNTIAQVGEYANASSNPEVIAPLSKLKNILADSGGSGGNVKFRIQGKELVGVLDNYSSIKRKR